MFSPIPYYKNGKIKKICIDSRGYIVTRYSNSEESYSVKMTLSDNNTWLLEKEYYDTVKDFLDVKRVDYELSRRNIDNKVNMKLNKSILLISLLSFFVPILGICYSSIPILLLGVFTTICSIFGISYSYENIKKNKINMVNKEFCDNYDNLKRVYTNHIANNTDKVNLKTNVEPTKVDKKDVIKQKIKRM